ncbi:MAG: hypothetical protein ACKVHH_08050 [Candidatus Poseidoniales archaeon]|jgi:response regulator of citrate/malate metabolism|tara:strand:+ start:51 stop:416 length:366 start_codon:yes stop_codon:yes gene_type:complete
MKVLAFEDSFDIEALLISGNVGMERIEFLQKWNTSEWLNDINEFKPDILLLDHFIPPTKGLEVLQLLNVEIHHQRLNRPTTIIGISSSSMANQRMLQFGADLGIIKMELASLDIWKRPTIG